MEGILAHCRRSPLSPLFWTRGESERLREGMRGRLAVLRAVLAVLPVDREVAADITKDEFFRRGAFGTQDLTERLSFQMALLKRAWKVPLEKRVTKKWILAHNRPRALTVFQNLKTIE